MCRALIAVVLVAGFARAEEREGNFVAPRVGVGGGVGGHTFSDGVMRVDLGLGGEWKRPAGDALGFDVLFGWLGTVRKASDTTWSSLRLGSSFVWSSSFADEKPFGGVATGPVLAVTWVGGASVPGFGGGWQLEGTAGFKSLAELFVSVSVTVDRAGLWPCVSAGARLNLVLFVKFLYLVEQIVAPPHVPYDVPDPSYK